MARILTASVLAVAVFAFVFAPVARADDGGDLDAKIDKAIKDYFKEQKSDFRVYWKNGLNFVTPDKKFQMSIGGRIQVDTWFFDDDNISPALGTWDSGFEFRRARLYVDGTLWRHVYFKGQYDFAGQDADFKDVYMKLVNLDECWGCAFPDIWIGHFKEPFSLEELTSDKYTTFIERALPVEAFAMSRNTGIGISKALMGDHLTWALGFFGHNVDDSGDGFWGPNGEEGGYDVTARITGLVWAPCDCEYRFLHLGVSASYQDGFDEIHYDSRPETHLGSQIVDTGAFAADSAFVVGGEIAFGYDRWHFQGEYIMTSVSSDVANDPTFFGYYAEASYMLTGGARPFKRSSATFDKVKPCRYFLEDCCGMGGLELAARYSYLDLEDSNVTGGKVGDVTVGLNWYLNVNTAIRFNYVYTDVDRNGVSDSMNSFGVRFAVWF